MNQAIREAARSGGEKVICPRCQSEIESPSQALKNYVERYGCAACSHLDTDLGLIKPV